MANQRVSLSCSGLSSIVVAVLITFISRPAHSRTLESDAEVLRSFTASIDPNSVPPYLFISTCDFKMDPCESSGELFLGILCSTPVDNSSSRVTAIDLDGIGYDGFLPPVIGNLTEITVLSFKQKQLSRAITWKHQQSKNAHHALIVRKLLHPHSACRDWTAEEAWNNGYFRKQSLWLNSSPYYRALELAPPKLVKQWIVRQST